MPFAKPDDTPQSETSESWIPTTNQKILALGGVALTTVGYLVYRYYKYEHVMFGGKSWFTSDTEKRDD